jgi:hypothetical protein
MSQGRTCSLCQKCLGEDLVDPGHDRTVKNLRRACRTTSRRSRLKKCWVIVSTYELKLNKKQVFLWMSLHTYRFIDLVTTSQLEVGWPDWANFCPHIGRLINSLIKHLKSSPNILANHWNHCSVRCLSLAQQKRKDQFWNFLLQLIVFLSGGLWKRILSMKIQFFIA